MLTRRRIIVLVAGLAVVVAIAFAVSGGDDGDERGTPEPSVTTTTDPSSPPEPGAPELSPVAQKLGFYPGSPNDGGIEQFLANEEWLGRPVAYFTAYGEGGSLDGFRANATAQFGVDKLGRWAAAGETPPFRLVYTVPLAFGDRHADEPGDDNLVIRQWDALISDRTVGARHPSAAGLDRGFYRAFAQSLVDLGFGDAIIRLASEHDNATSRWPSEVSYDKFKSAYRVVVDEMRSVAPDLEFDFTSILLNFGPGPDPSGKVSDAYPGGDYVDYIGVDVYDQGNVDPAIGVPDGDTCGWRDPEQVFETYHRPALDTAARFAAAQGKPLTVPEWGLSGGGSNFVRRCGGDNPVFVERMHGWLEALGDRLAYASYFEGNPPHDGPHELRFFPDARDRFAELFGSESGRPADG